MLRRIARPWQPTHAFTRSSGLLASHEGERASRKYVMRGRSPGCTLQYDLDDNLSSVVVLAVALVNRQQETAMQVHLDSFFRLDKLARKTAIALSVVTTMTCSLSASGAPPLVTNAKDTSFSLQLLDDTCSRFYVSSLFISENINRGTGIGAGAQLYAFGQNVCTGEYLFVEGYTGSITFIKNAGGKVITAYGNIPTTTSIGGIAIQDNVYFNLTVTASTNQAPRKWGTTHESYLGTAVTTTYDATYTLASVTGSVTGTFANTPYNGGVYSLAEIQAVKNHTTYITR